MPKGPQGPMRPPKATEAGEVGSHGQTSSVFRALYINVFFFFFWGGVGLWRGKKEGF